MASKREILETLSRAKLLELAKAFELTGLTGKPKAEVVRAMAGQRGVPVEKVLEQLNRAQLKAVCRALGLDDKGREKALLVARLVGDGADSTRPSRKTPSAGRKKKEPEQDAGKPEGTRTMAKKRKKAAGAKRPIEQYAHKGKTRVNNPPVGLVTPRSDPDSPRKTYEYDPHLDPQLVWAGKAERTSFEVPTASLHVHERIDPCSIIRAV